MGELKKVTIFNYLSKKGKENAEIPLSYQLFGQPLHSAPIVLVNHALTGNSNVSGTTGWWKDIIGENCAIDTNTYTILSFNIPGNGYDGFLIENYKDFVAQDIAQLFLLGLKELKIDSLFALIGGSLGGGIAWQMAVLQPQITKHLIVVATDWKATDWLIANCQIQEQLLNNSKNPVHDARMHAMLCYRTPKSFKERFQRSKNEDLQIFNVESWLLHHGKKLQERFQLSAYKLMNQLLKTIDATQGNHIQTLDIIKANIHIIGVDSDLFFTAEENRETYRKMAQNKANITYNEINSAHGHDAFLIEYNQLEKIIEPIFNKNLKNKSMKILKFGGKSLANGKGVTNTTAIISKKTANHEKIAVVVSARGNTTDELESILEKAKKGEDYTSDFKKCKDYQTQNTSLTFTNEFTLLDEIFRGVKLLGDYSKKIKNEVLAQGELISAQYIADTLKKNKVKAVFVDARKLIITDSVYENATPIETISNEKTIAYFEALPPNTVPIITGFIAANSQGETTTLGRNGSNYTASLIANFTNAQELQNYTHVDGIFTANPDLVENAKVIQKLSFQEANELANFGTNVLHAKTIIPLIEKNIPLRILNTFNSDGKGTLISSEAEREGIKSLSVLKNVTLVNLIGRGFLGKSGVDARIFTALGKNNISVSIISQGSSERGIGFVVDEELGEKAQKVLKEEFENEFKSKDISDITLTTNVSVISIVGQDLKTFHKPYGVLIKNHITPILINNSVTGNNVSLVVFKKDLHKALHVIHGEIFGVYKTINLAIFGKGLVGGTLIQQILDSQQHILKRKNILLNIFAIADSQQVLLSKNGISKKWKEQIKTQSFKNYKIEDVIAFAEKNHLGNLIAVDNTASKDFIKNYIPLSNNGFDLISSNKIANTVTYSFYKELRETIEKNGKKYLYETNVGAGLPLIDTIRLLHESGENITRIVGVLSGSLSYLFNNFSVKDQPFSEVLKEAVENGYTEPDPREDLCGNDVGRKLLILARELDLQNEFEDIEIENLIPKELQSIDASSFLERINEMDKPYETLKKSQKPNHVLRYVGELSGDLQQEKGNLQVKLVSVPSDTALGQIKGADAIFEIYTESYGDKPIVIQGAGAGAKVTARGVFGDILRLSDR